MPLIPPLPAWQDEFAQLRRQIHPPPEEKAPASRLLATYLNEA